MRAVTSTGRPGRPGRTVWRVSGIVTAAALAIPGTWAIARAGNAQGPAPASSVPVAIRTVTITQPVTSVNAQSYGAPIQVTTGSGSQVTVTEAITVQPGTALPTVTAAVRQGQLILNAPACADGNCGVGFTVTVPGRVAVTAVSGGGDVLVAGATAANLNSGGGDVRASGTAGSLAVSSGGGDVAVAGSTGASIDSGGGDVQAAGVHGTLTASTEGGSLAVSGLTGPLHADTGGGPLSAQGLATTTATVSTDGGVARMVFTTAPDSVHVTTGGGAADLAVPGGPYAVAADSGGGPESLDVATDPSAARSLSVSSSGGPLVIAAAGAGAAGAADPLGSAGSVLPPSPPAPPF